MTDLDSVIVKLDEQARKLDKIETAIVQMAVQDNEIKNIQGQVAALWKKTEELNKPDGPLNTILVGQSKVLERQKNCKVHGIGTQVKILWVAIVGMALTVIAKTIGGS